MTRKKQIYAVAVRDSELYLFLRITRNPIGEAFVIIPVKDPDERKFRK